MFEVFLYQASCVTRYTALEPRQKIAREHKPPPKKLDSDGFNSGSEDHVKTLGASDDAQDAPPCNNVWLWRFRRPSTRTRSGRGPRTSNNCTNASLVFDNFVVVVFIFPSPSLWHASHILQ